MFITMGVGLFTSRLVLDTLGVVDYGIYGLVGGIVTMFAFLNSSMTSATQRYLSFDIGMGDTGRIQKTFNASLNIHFLIGLIILILAETIGLWFVSYKLNIPTDRISSIHWVYQLSVVTFILEVIQVPYNALLIARENMSVYAYISILEAVLKLIVVFLLIKVNADKLVLYALLSFGVAFLIRLIYKVYCKRHYKETVYKFFYNKEYYRELISFSSWNLFGNMAVIARGQGGNILLNLFFGPIANAAFSLTNMVQGVMTSFVSNFQVAINPQIIKNYATGNARSSLNLIFLSSKFSFYAMLILILPILYNIQFVLELWLGKIPPYTIDFLSLALCYALIETISNPLMIGAQATGKIKWYQIFIGTFIFLTLPATWIVFKYSNNAVNLYWILIINSSAALGFRILFLRKMIGLDLKAYCQTVLLRILMVSVPLVVLVKLTSIPKAQNISELIAQSFVVIIIVFFTIIFFGINKSERSIILQLINSKIKTQRRLELWVEK